ncbi:unnamed protein product [Schistosoma turkestanicum]|nr:unnamed protein product [Schistosoma turkestanicum]
MKLTVLFYLNIFVLYIHISSGSEYSSLMMKSLNRKLENADGNEVYFSMMSAYYDEELIYFTKYVNDYLHPANKPINDYVTCESRNFKISETLSRSLVFLILNNFDETLNKLRAYESCIDNQIEFYNNFQYLQDLAWNKAFYEYGYYNFHNSA